MGMPLLYLPSKETVEEIFLKGKRKMTSRENLICTLVLIVISYVIAIFIPDIGDAMALAGCTTNPMVGFYFLMV
jgi:amino acid permease